MRTFLIAVLSLGLLAGNAAAGTPAEDAAMAKEHYKKGTKLYDLGKYDEAIKSFEAAFELKDEPVLLYNIAQAYRLANKYPEALRFYRTYLRRSPKAPNKGEVDQKISDMERLIAEQNRIQNGPPVDPIALGQKPTATKTPPAAPTPSPASVERPAPTPAPEPEPEPVVASVERPSEPAEKDPEPTARPPISRPERAPAKPTPAPAAKPGNGKLFAGIALAVVGVGAAAGGIVMGITAMGAGAQQEKLARDGQPFDPALESKGKTFGLVGAILDGAGGALAVTGVVLAVLGARENSKTAERPVAVRPAVAPGYAGAELSVRF